MQLKPLDDLIRRYEAGERSPGLIQALNEAAWTGFHDPWETPPGPKTREEEDMADDPVDESTYDMEAVRPLSQGMIKRFLRMKGWSFWEHSDGSLMVHFRYDPASDRETLLRLSIQGKDSNIFQMNWTSDRRVLDERFDQAFRLCNEWSDQARWPRAYVEMSRVPTEDGEEEKEPTSGLLTLDLHLFLDKGIHQELFNDMVRCVIASGWDFWTRANSKYGL